MLTGSLLLTSLDNQKKCSILIGFGVVLLGLSWFWNMSFPVNKKLWTSSYVLWSGGYALLTFGFCFFMTDVLGFKKWALPLKIFGMNALFIFIFHVLLLKVQAPFHFHMRNGTVDNLG